MISDKPTPEEIRELLKQRQDAMRFLAILVERAGGEVRIAPSELADHRFLERDDIAYTGVVVLRARRI